MAFRKILVAIDGSDPSWKALEIAAELAVVHEAPLLVLHVTERIDRPDALGEIAKAEHVPVEEANARFIGDMHSGDALVRDAVARVERPGLVGVEGRVAEGKPAHEILSAATAEGADAIVLGSRGLGDARSAILGSISHKVAHLADVSVILVR